mmetsp:Transcript_31235/g.73091  ORF Transcript_31235/g.73091 Transcript_31235/m.73091 type:complete len:280 (+) Transcript_31235:696-1535(+)
MLDTRCSHLVLREKHLLEQVGAEELPPCQLGDDVEERGQRMPQLLPGHLAIAVEVAELEERAHLDLGVFRAHGFEGERPFLKVDRPTIILIKHLEEGFRGLGIVHPQIRQNHSESFRAELGALKLRVLRLLLLDGHPRLLELDRVHGGAPKLPQRTLALNLHLADDGILEPLPIPRELVVRLDRLALRFREIRENKRPSREGPHGPPAPHGHGLLVPAACVRGRVPPTVERRFAAREELRGGADSAGEHGAATSQHGLLLDLSREKGGRRWKVPVPVTS